MIGLWPEHLGVFVCPTCQKVTNIPISTGKCPGCGYSPTLDEYYDYAYAIPYLRGPFDEREAGPVCPKCGGGRLTFTTTAHINVGLLGSQEPKIWLGIDSLEKAIFVYSIVPVTQEFGLDWLKVQAYFNIDMPRDKRLILDRRLSVPIVMDIRTRLVVMQQIEPEAFAKLRK